VGATANGSASGTTRATPEDVWHRVSDGSRVVAWWPHAERAEDVQGGVFTLVLRSSRGVPVRTDWQVSTSRRPELQRWEQGLAGTPFAKAFARSAIEVRIAPADDGGSRVTVAVERELVQGGPVAGLLGRRAARRQAGAALSGLLRSVSSGG
jgi:carbon monoxide dehydrogenase subunit G